MWDGLFLVSLSLRPRHFLPAVTREKTQMRRREKPKKPSYASPLCYGKQRTKSLPVGYCKGRTKRDVRRSGVGEGTGRFLLPLRSMDTLEDTRFSSSGSFLAHTIYFGFFFSFFFPIPRGNLYPWSPISWLPLPTTIPAFLHIVKRIQPYILS